MHREPSRKRRSALRKREVGIALALGATLVTVSLAFIAVPPSPASEGTGLGQTEVSTPTTVPFEFPHEQIVFEVFLGEQGPFNFILDTAVNPSVIDLALSQEIGFLIDDDSPTSASGVGNDPVLVYPTELSGLSIGGTEFPPFPAVAMNLEPFAGSLGRPFHGALGYSFLRSRAVRIDYPGRTITLYDGAVPEGDRHNGSDLPFTLLGTDVALDSVYLNGRRLRVALDTGASLALTVSSRMADRLGVEKLASAATPGLVRGARGTAQVRRATADSLRVGGQTMQSPEISFAEWIPDSHALLGNGFLSRFVLTVDYVAESLSLVSPALEH